MPESRQPPQIVPGLAAIADGFDAMVCDVWGVVHNGREAFPGVVDCLKRFRAERGPVALVTNAPRPSSVLPPQLARLGVPAEAYDVIVTSGDATRFEMDRRGPAKAFHLGPDRDLGLFDAEAIALTHDPEAADFILCSGLYDDTTETPEDYAEILATLHERRLEMVCANPDIQVIRGDQLIYCAGALAQAYAGLGGTVVYAGKPHPPIYELARQRLDALKGGLASERILAVGDGPKTDVRGANVAGLPCLFVAGSGLHGAEVAEGPDLAASIAAVLDRDDTFAAFAVDRLVW